MIIYWYKALVPKMGGGREHIAGEAQAVITKYNFYFKT